jgi:hypothetical protein
LLPFWLILYSLHTDKHRKTAVAIGVIYEFIWLTIVVSSIIPKPQGTISLESATSTQDTKISYESKSREYLGNFYSRLKAAQAKESTPQEQSETPKTEQQQTSPTQNNTQTQPNNSNEQEQAPAQTDLADPMSGITIAEDDGSPYLRKDWGSGWNVGQGCNIRQRLLAQQSTVHVQTSDGCVVTYGIWDDPYSDRILEGNPYLGDGEDNDLDIDHIIPLRYVNGHGGYAWSHDKKISYGKSLEAMKNGVYVAVSSYENRKKSDQGPASYYPPARDYYCTYSQKWRDIARIYQISLSQADYDKIKQVLQQCGIQ